RGGGAADARAGAAREGGDARAADGDALRRLAPGSEAADADLDPRARLGDARDGGGDGGDDLAAAAEPRGAQGARLPRGGAVARAAPGDRPAARRGLPGRRRLRAL